MRSLMTQLGRVAGLAALAALTAGPAAAQCTHLTGDPAPVPELLASKIRMRAGGGSWTNGRFKFAKGYFNPAMMIDPLGTHTFHFTLRHIDGDENPALLEFTIPAGAPWEDLGGGKFRYNDGIIKIRMRDYGGHVFYKLIGRNVSIPYPPLVFGDTVHLMLEMEDAGVGHCGDWTGTCLTTTATSASCN